MPTEVRIRETENATFNLQKFGRFYGGVDGKVELVFIIVNRNDKELARSKIFTWKNEGMNPNSQHYVNDIYFISGIVKYDASGRLRVKTGFPSRVFDLPTY